MSDDHILKGLVELGLDEKQASDLTIALEGGDYVNLVNALGIQEPQKQAKTVAGILSKYGITISKETGDMAESKNYLSAMFSKFREGKGTAIDTAILGEWLKPISESNAPDISTLVMEGFNYFMQLEDSMQGEPLMDWLDENKIEYITDGKGQFHIKCGDRESAYKVGKAANGLVMKKRLVRDQIGETSFDVETTKGVVKVQGSDEFAAKRNARNQGYTVVESKSAKQREAEAKAKMADIKPRNQDLLALSQRGGKGAHKDDTRKADEFDRKAKHKKIPVDEAAGLSIDNQVVDDLTDTLAESVLGMKVLSPIFRLRELAGMAPAPLAAPDIDELAGIEVDHDDTGFNLPKASAPSALASGPVDVEDPFMASPSPAPDDAMSDLLPDAGMGDLDPMAGGMGTMAPMGGMGGMPGDLPPMGGEAVLAVPTQSDAMSHIEDCLNDIQGKLAEIRLAEYKSLVQKLTSLTQQVQTMGRDYLGEQRRKK